MEDEDGIPVRNQEFYFFRKAHLTDFFLLTGRRCFESLFLFLFLLNFFFGEE